MKIEDFKEQEILNELSSIAINFKNRLTSGGSEIHKDGQEVINIAKRDLLKAFVELSKSIQKIAEKNIGSSEQHGDTINRKVAQSPKEVAKLIFDDILKEIKKL